MRSRVTRALFQDRVDAGRALGSRLWEYADRSGVVVVGLPRGGVPVAAEVARKLNALLDIWLVRKLGVPGQPEYAMGAIASGGVVELDQNLVRELHISAEAVESIIAHERAELERREKAYRRGRTPVRLTGRIAIVVDDGIATGSTMRAAVSAIKAQSPARIVVAAPVASIESCVELEQFADACVCVATPELFRAVGFFYADFAPTSDAEVTACLDRFKLWRDARMGDLESARPATEPHSAS
jgi:putative phosphoribosyl transferase